MKVVIFSGGSGSRLSEETVIKPKPMVDICGKPILMHIMEHYSKYGHNDFIILGGYKCEYIKDYFLNYYHRMCDFKVNLQTGEVTRSLFKSNLFNGTVTVLDTGINTLTGSRLAQAKYLLQDEPFMLTYGDGISDINIAELEAEAKKANKILTMSVVSPKMRFGTVELDEKNNVKHFYEKLANQDKINGGFMVVKPDIFKFIPTYNVMFEDVPMHAVTDIGQCHAYVPPAATYWHAVDTLKDKLEVEQYINNTTK